MREEADNWWRQAKHDLETADFLLEGEKLDAAAFYFQQTVEKALKALYIATKKEAPEATHSLTKLGRACGLPPEFSGFLRRLAAEYYVSRYPDATGDVPYMTYDESDVAEFSRETHEALRWVEQQLNK